MNSNAISIAVTFLNGRYHGAEWPPSPSRLYQALVAGVMTGGYRNLLSAVEPALRWLEQQKPPSILASPAIAETPYRIAIPNNDLDRAGLEWSSGRSESDDANPAKYRTMKTISTRAVCAEGPHVVYQWSVDPNDLDRWIDPLRQASHCLHTLGWGTDMAFADVISDGSNHAMPFGDLYLESAGGQLALNVPITGTLDDLQTTHERFIKRNTGKGVDTYTRPSMIDTRRYAIEGEQRASIACFRLIDAYNEKTKSVPWSEAMKVAAWLRHAAAQALSAQGWHQQKIASYVQGHTADDQKSNRISYAPLPNISGPYPDGRIRRVMITEPPASSGEAAQALFSALNGHELRDDHGKPVASLLASNEAADQTFQHYVSSSGERWASWRSVTPVVLHGFNVQRRGVIDVGKTEKLLVRAFEMAGHPADTISHLSFQAGPLWAGTGHASAMLLPQHLAKYPRLHVEVTFKKPVSGPVLAGIGRHYGIGLFARLRSKNP